MIQADRAVRAGTTIPFSEMVQLSCSPNPCTDLLTISYSGAGGTEAVLTVLDLSGRVVKTIGTVQPETAVRSVAWGAADDSGSRVPAGIYLVRLNSTQEDILEKVSILP